MEITVNYKQIYNNLIYKHGYSHKPKIGYFEKHHIIPKCLGGSDDESNLIYLSARCHLLAHWILCKIYPENNKIVHAFFMMCIMKNSNMKRIIPNTKILAEARRRKSAVQSKLLKNSNIQFCSDESKRKSKETAVKNGSYRGRNNARANPVDIYDYFSGELIASDVLVTEWIRKYPNRNLNATLYADRTKPSSNKNRHHAKGLYIVKHGSLPYKPKGGKYKGPYSNQGHIGLKKKKQCQQI